MLSSPVPAVKPPKSPGRVLYPPAARARVPSAQFRSGVALATRLGFTCIGDNPETPDLV